MQRFITLGLALYSYFLIETNISNLPARIPTHFNFAGQADGWGSRDTLWWLLLVQALASGTFLLVPLMARRFPGAVNVGSRKLTDFTGQQRAQILPLLDGMMGSLSVLVAGLFAILLHETIRAALSSHARLPPWPLALFLAGMAVTIIYYMRRVFRMGKEKNPEQSGEPA